MILDIPTAEVFEPLLAPARYKGAHGGRGSGKSQFFADMWLDESIREKLDFVCLRETQKSLEFSVKKLLESKIEQYNAGAYFDVQDRRIFSKHGGVTIFDGLKNHTSDSIKSLEGFDRAWVEEAQAVSDKSLTILRPTLRKPGSELWFSWNPDQPTDPVDLLLRGDVLPPNATVVEANYNDNPWFWTTELVAEMEYDRAKDPDKYSHVWLGRYNQRSDKKVFKNWRIEEFDAPSNAVFRFGADWGFSVDPTVLVRCYLDGRKLYIDYEAYRVGCEILDTPELFMSVPESEKWPMTADSARPETISHMRKNGFPKIQAAIKGAKSLEDGISWLQSLEIIVHPRCSHTIDELTHYSYEVDKLTDQVLPKLQDKDNHVIDAIRYACEGARRAQKSVSRPVVNVQPVVHRW